jgi:anthranilate phosphoribosyltransferase
MDQLIAKIGKGLKGAKDLTWDEAKTALNTIIEGQATDIQVGAFLMAMRIKTESIGELAAFTATVRNWAPPIQFPHPAKMVDVPLYGEKHNTIHVVVAASLVAASAGAGMFMHGVENSQVPYDLPQVLRHLRLPIAHTASEAIEHASQRPWVYMDLAGYHAPLTKLLDLRREFGLQNLSHQLARLLNPARVPSQVIGISHPPYLDKMVEALDMLGAKRALIIQGVEGFPELSISAPSMARELRSGHISSLIFRPDDAGFRIGPFQAMSSMINGPGTGSPEHEAQLMTQVLFSRQQRGDQRAWVIVNAALLIYAAGLASSLSQATPLAQDALDSGKAGAFFTALVQGRPSQTKSVVPPAPAVMPA